MLTRWALAALVLVFGCSRAPDHSLLSPSGTPGGTTHCTSQFQTIQLAGNLSPAYGNFDLTKAPQMVKGTSCVWTVTITGVTAGDHFFKFVTDGKFDSPQDYGGDEVCRASLSGTTMLVSGQGTAICVTFAEGGSYMFTLDETALTYKIEKVVVQQPGSIKGTVTYDVAPPSGTKTYITAFPHGQNSVSGEDSTSSGSYEVTGLAAGSYDVRFSAQGYLDTTRTATVTGGQATDIGATQMTHGCASRYSQIQLAGNINTDLYGNFDLTRSLSMTRLAGCRWEATANVKAGQRLFKFVTGGAFDNPPDYGGSETNCFSFTGQTLTGAVRQASGTGTALCATFPVDGMYKFTLDEAALTMTVENLTPVAGGTLIGTLDLGGAAHGAYIQVRPHGTANTVAADSAATTFRFDNVPPGDYDVVFSGAGFLDTTRAAAVTSSHTTDLGATRLTPGCVSTHTVILFANNLHDPDGFNLAKSAHMTSLGSCRWQVQVDSVAAGDHYFKFVTDSAYASPADYGGDDNCTNYAGGTLTRPVLVVTNPAGEALCLTFAQDGNYRITLDESALSYTVEKLSAAPRARGASARNRPALQRGSAGTLR